MIRRAHPRAPPRRARGGGLFPLPSPFRFLITVSAKALSGQLLRSLCYLHGRLPTDLLFPFQERLSRCPIHICLRHLFLDFLLHFILSPTSQKARSKEYWWLQERGWGVFPLILWSLLPAASSAVFLRVQPREQMECGYQGANLCSAGPGSKRPQNLDSTEPQRPSYPQDRNIARLTITANLQLTSSSQYLLLLMPQALC